MCRAFGGNKGRRLSEFGCGGERNTAQSQRSGDYHLMHGANVPNAQKQHGGTNDARSAWEPAKEPRMVVVSTGQNANPNASEKQPESLGEALYT